MSRCSICGKETNEEWVNPSNPEDRAYYCKEHLAGIKKGFANFRVLMMLKKVGVLK